MKPRSLVFILAADLALILLIETLFRLIGLFAPQSLFTEFKDPQGQTQVMFSISATRPVFPASFPAQKPAGAVRIMAYGESTTYGFPFHEKTSFPAELDLLLNRARPNRKWEIINLAMVNLDSEQVRDIFLASLQYHPDLTIIYCGQNEYVRSNLRNEIQHPRLIALRNFLSRRSRIYQALIRLRNFVEAALEPASLRKKQAPQPLSPQLLRLRQDLFRRHLEQILDAAQAARVPVILSTVASNLRDWPPSPLPYPPGLSADQIQELDRLVSAAEKKLDDQDAAGTAPALRQAQALAPGYPLLDFLSARTLELQSRRDPARELYLRALRGDAALDRAPPEISSIIRDLAHNHKVALVDAEQLFADHSAFAAPGFDLFMDHVHPNLAGQALIAGALLNAIRLGEFPFSAGIWQPAPDLTEDEIIRVFDLEPDYLADVRFRINKVLQVKGWVPEARE